MNISRKILVPPLPPRLLYREQLSQLLGEALSAGSDTHTLSPYRLALLCAPAGYGKTTLLVDTLQRLDLPCCWLTLDRSDQQGPVFITTLLASIRQRFPAFPAQPDSFLSLNEVPEETLDVLLETLEKSITEHWILVLDNYHEINDSLPAKKLINHLLKHLPVQCLVVIESRALPDLDLASLIARHQMFGLGRESLRFTAQEVCALAQIQNLPPFSDEEAAEIISIFDGWIAGILLATRLRKTVFDAFISSHAQTQETIFTGFRYLHAYVLSEVFHDETAIYTLLKETSFLDPLAPTFCDRLLNKSDTAILLERAQNRGLFVTCSYEGETRIYHCHPTIRQMFQEEFRQHEPEMAYAIHRRIAHIYYETYAYQAALRHAIEAQAHDFIAEILLEVHQALLEQEQSELILRGLKGLPSSIIEQHPRLLLLQANIYLQRGNAASARHCFEQAQHLVTELANIEQPPTRAELAIVQGKLLIQQGAYRLAQQNFRKALELISIDDRQLRILAHQQCGICSILCGQPISEGIAHFQHAFQLCHPQREAELAGELHHQLANAYMWAGNYPAAEYHRNAIRVLQGRLGQPHKILNNFIGLGLLKLRQGLLEEAEAAFQSTLQLTQQQPRFLSSHAYALVGLAEITLTRQQTLKTLEYLQEALTLARQLEDQYLLNDTLGMLALAYLQLDERHTASELLDQMNVPKQESHSYESVFHQLVSGTVLFAEQQYNEAAEMLEYVAQLTRESGIVWLQIQALLRLAACQLAQDKLALARSTFQQVRKLNAQDDHTYYIEVEFQTYPCLQSLLQEQDTQTSSPEISVLSDKRLRIHALGEPAVRLDGNLATSWRRARALELFFFLLESKEPLRKDKIISALWPEFDDEESVNQTFRSTVYCIRKVLGDACLVYRSGLYQLDLQTAYGDTWYDVALFEEYERTAKRADEEEDDEQAKQAYTKMVDLYRGKYADAFYSDWCSARRDTLHQSLMEARRQLALISWRQEDWEESLHHWQHLLTLDPCLETAHYGIMRCYMRQGKRDLALRQYQRCCRELHEQLGAEPGSALQKFYQRLATPQA